MNKLAQEKRDLARRARRLAQTQSVDADRARLTQFATELDEEAQVLERGAPPISLPPVGSPHLQLQQQVQQQQSVGSPTQTRPAKRKDQAGADDAGSACEMDS